MKLNASGPVWAEIHLDRLCNNLRIISDHLKPNTKIMAVVKGDAYGHGAAAIATELERNGIEYFAVASLREGIELRRSGIKGTILTLELILPEQIEKVFQYQITTSLYNLELAKTLALKAKQLHKRAKVHLRIDTGMGGLGMPPRESRELTRQSKWLEWLEVEGVYTHLISDYRGDGDSVRSQLEIFHEVLHEIKTLGIHIPLIHAASSLAIFSLSEAHFNMVRPGIALYGIPPVPGLAGAGLLPVMQLKSRISCLKSLAANEHIGTYHDIFTTVKPVKYAIIPIGYADAFFLLTVRKAEVLIRGKHAPIIGQARMNHILVDVTLIPAATTGDEVIIIGEQGKQKITAQATTINAGIAPINCESVCLLNSRVPRVYYNQKDMMNAGGADWGVNSTPIAGAVND